jgi:hypothetical protein
MNQLHKHGGVVASIGLVLLSVYPLPKYGYSLGVPYHWYMGTLFVLSLLLLFFLWRLPIIYKVPAFLAASIALAGFLLTPACKGFVYCVF